MAQTSGQASGTIVWNCRMCEGLCQWPTAGDLRTPSVSVNLLDQLLLRVTTMKTFRAWAVAYKTYPVAVPLIRHCTPYTNVDNLWIVCRYFISAANYIQRPLYAILICYPAPSTTPYMWCLLHWLFLNHQRLFCYLTYIRGGRSLHVLPIHRTYILECLGVYGASVVFIPITVRTF